MSVKINLLIKKEQKETLKKIKKIVFSGSFLFLANLIIISSSLYAYWRILAKQNKILEEAVGLYQTQIASFGEVEEKKSLLSARVEKIGEIYAGRLDFVKALEDLENLFGNKIKIDSLTLNKEGQARIITKESEEIILDPSVNLSKDIQELRVELTTSSSAELEDFINNLYQLKTQGLSYATLTSLKRTEIGGYEIGLDLKIAK